MNICLNLHHFLYRLLIWLMILGELFGLSYAIMPCLIGVHMNEASNQVQLSKAERFVAGQKEIASLSAKYL